MPKTLPLLMSFSNCLLRKYLVMDSVLLRHCSMEFMKHVLPRFSRPVAPAIGGVPFLSRRLAP